jgi:formylmethanofuran dehydrogenase subunit E
VSERPTQPRPVKVVTCCGEAQVHQASCRRCGEPFGPEGAPPGWWGPADSLRKGAERGYWKGADTPVAVCSRCGEPVVAAPPPGQGGEVSGE